MTISVQLISFTNDKPEEFSLESAAMKKGYHHPTKFQISATLAHLHGRSKNGRAPACEVKDSSLNQLLQVAVVSHHLNAVPSFCVPAPPSDRVLLHSSRLLPLRHQPDQTANSAGDTDNAVVKVDPAEGRGGHGQIAEV